MDHNKISIDFNRISIDFTYLITKTRKLYKFKKYLRNQLTKDGKDGKVDIDMKKCFNLSIKLINF